MSLRWTILRFSLCLFLIKCVASDEYIDEIRNKCFKSKILIYCGHYRLMKYISKFYGDSEELQPNSYNSSVPVKLVKLKKDDIDFSDYPNTRQINEEPEITKLVKFLTRKTLTYLNSNGLIIHLPDGSNVVGVQNGTLDLDKAREDESTRGKKQKKKMLIIPILLLFKMFKVKVLLGFVLAGIVFIKKVMLAVALLLPAMFSHLKSHCKSEDKPHYYADDRYYYSYPDEHSTYNSW